MQNKTLLLLFFCLFAGTSVNAQIEKPFTKGHMLIGGSFDFYSGKKEYEETYTKYNGFEIDLYAGYFLLDKFAAGIKTDWGYKKSIYKSIWMTYPTDFERTFIIESFLRYYLSFGLFGEVSAGFGKSKLSSGSDLNKNNDLFAWNTGIGYSLIIAKNIAVEPLLNYTFTKVNEVIEYNGMKEIKGLNLHIGIQVYFNLNKKN